MKPSSNYRLEARNMLQNRWTESAVATLLIFFCVGLFSGPYLGFTLNKTSQLGTSISTLVFVLGVFLLVAPLQYAYNIAFLRRARYSENTLLKDIMAVFGVSYSRAVKSTLLITAYILLIATAAMIVAVVITIPISMLVTPDGVSFAEYISNDEGSTVFAAIMLVIMYLIMLPCTMVFAYAIQPYMFVVEEHPEWGIATCVKETIKIMKGHKAKLFVLDLSFIGWGILATMTGGIGMLWLQPYMAASHAAFYEDLTKGNTYISEDLQ